MCIFQSEQRIKIKMPWFHWKTIDHRIRHAKIHWIMTCGV